MKMKFIIAAMVIGVLLRVSSVMAQPEYGEDLPRLVTTDWLAANLEMKDLRIIDMRDSVKAYWENHIPGAVYVHPDALRWPDAGVPVKLMPLKDFADLLERLGISRNTYVVVYGEAGDYKAPYFLWALDYIGHKYAGIVDGGFTKWQNEQRPLTQDYPKIRPQSYSVSAFRTQHGVRAELGDVKYAVQTGDTLILDARPHELYTGEQGPWKRLGHIKGARHHFWGDDLNPDGTFKTEDALKKVYDELGITDDTRVIVSCGQGQMSAHTYFVLRYILGHKRVKNYDAGFNEWSNIEDLPTGKILIK